MYEFVIKFSVGIDDVSVYFRRDTYFPVDELKSICDNGSVICNVQTNVSELFKFILFLTDKLCGNPINMEYIGHSSSVDFLEFNGKISNISVNFNFKNV